MTSLLILMGVLMDVFWVYPWLAWAGQLPALGWSGAPLTLPGAVGLALVPCFVTRWLLVRKLPIGRVRLGTAIAGVVTLLLVLRLEYPAGSALLDASWFLRTGARLMESPARSQPLAMALATGAFLWWRGVTWGRSSCRFQEIYRRFGAGLVIIVLLVIVWGASLGTPFAAYYVAGFFFCGLSALALANLEAARRDLKDRGEPGAGLLTRRWLAILFGVAGGMVLLGVLVAGAASVDLVAVGGRVLNAMADGLLQALYYVLVPIGYVVAGLVYAGRFIVALLRREPGPQEGFQPPDLSKLREAEEEAASGGLPPGVVLALKWLWLAAIAGLVLYLLVRAVRARRAAGGDEDIEEVQESLWDWQGFKADLRQFLAGLLGRLKRGLPARPAPAAWYADDGPETRLGIRELYRRLLWEAGLSGLARGRPETAHEYARRLSARVPDGDGALAELTGLYAGVRYGETAATERGVDRANDIWRPLKGLLRAFRAPGPS